MLRASSDWGRELEGLVGCGIKWKERRVDRQSCHVCMYLSMISFLKIEYTILRWYSHEKIALGRW